MARTAHRTVIISAALAFASWALVAGAPALAAAPPEQAGPSLPPAKYKPLPVGTKVKYDTWGYTVTKSDGYDIRFKTNAGNWKKYYAVFGKFGDAAYTPRGDDWRTTLDDETRAALEGLWPLKVGKKAQWNLEESYEGGFGISRRSWTVTVEVVGTEVLELNGFLYPTYVVKEHAVSEGAVHAGSIHLPDSVGDPFGYLETKWYDPESGLVLKSVKEMTRGPKKGEQKEYSLVRVRFPRGTKTNVLAATKAPPAAARPPAARPLVRPPAPVRPAMAGPMAKKPRRMARADSAVAPAGGASLPPAKYRPLPVGTKVTYDTWGYTVTKTEGFDITFKTTAGDWKHYYAVFGKHGSDMYLRAEWRIFSTADWESDLDAESKAALETIWPLKVGKKVKLNLEELRGPNIRPWTVALEVVRAEILELNGLLYSTYVIQEHAVSEGAAGTYVVTDSPEGYSETKWYNPKSGLVLKSVKETTLGPKKGEQEEYSLVRVRFPKGTKTHVLAGTKVPGEADARLLAEIARLKRALQDPGFGAPERPAKVAAVQPVRKIEPAQVAAVQPARKIEPANIPDIEFGRYHALVIGIGNYKHLPRLKTAVKDAKAVADVLRQDYGFTVKLLLDPARRDIVDTLDEYRAALDQTDNLLIYYAGHGWLDEESNRGYWLAADARPNRRSNWVSNATITDTLKTLQAKHVMVVADSCYSGTLIRGAPVGLRSGNYWRRMAKKRARVALTSGGLEPVADIGGGGHSPFATAFIAALKGNAAVMDGTTLFNEVRRPVMLSADQTPEYSDVRRAGHDGGDFLFVRRR